MTLSSILTNPSLTRIGKSLSSRSSEIIRKRCLLQSFSTFTTTSISRENPCHSYRSKINPCVFLNSEPSLQLPSIHAHHFSTSKARSTSASSVRQASRKRRQRRGGRLTGKSRSSGSRESASATHERNNYGGRKRSKSRERIKRDNRPKTSSGNSKTISQAPSSSSRSDSKLSKYEPSNNRNPFYLHRSEQRVSDLLSRYYDILINNDNKFIHDATVTFPRIPEGYLTYQKWIDPVETMGSGTSPHANRVKNTYGTNLKDNNIHVHDRFTYHEYYDHISLPMYSYVPTYLLEDVLMYEHSGKLDFVSMALSKFSSEDQHGKNNNDNTIVNHEQDIQQLYEILNETEELYKEIQSRCSQLVLNWINVVSLPPFTFYKCSKGGTTPSANAQEMINFIDYNQKRNILNYPQRAEAWLTKSEMMRRDRVKIVDEISKLIIQKQKKAEEEKAKAKRMSFGKIFGSFSNLFSSPSLSSTEHETTASFYGEGNKLHQCTTEREIQDLFNSHTISDYNIQTKHFFMLIRSYSKTTFFESIGRMQQRNQQRLDLQKLNNKNQKNVSRIDLENTQQQGMIMTRSGRLSHNLVEKMKNFRQYIDDNDQHGNQLHIKDPYEDLRLLQEIMKDYSLVRTIEDAKYYDGILQKILLLYADIGDGVRFEDIQQNYKTVMHHYSYVRNSLEALDRCEELMEEFMEKFNDSYIKKNNKQTTSTLLYMYSRYLEALARASAQSSDENDSKMVLCPALYKRTEKLLTKVGELQLLHTDDEEISTQISSVYSLFLQIFSKLGNLSDPIPTHRAKELLGFMLKTLSKEDRNKHILPNTYSFNCVLESLLKLPEEIHMNTKNQSFEQVAELCTSYYKKLAVYSSQQPLKNLICPSSMPFTGDYNVHGSRPYYKTYKHLFELWKKSKSKDAGMQSEIIFSQMEHDYHSSCLVQLSENDRNSDINDQKIEVLKNLLVAAPNTELYLHLIENWGISSKYGKVTGTAKRAYDIMRRMELQSRIDTEFDSFEEGQKNQLSDSEQNLTPNASIYKAVIKVCSLVQSEREKEEALKLAFLTYNKMIRRGMTPPDTEGLLRCIVNSVPAAQSEKRAMLAEDIINNLMEMDCYDQINKEAKKLFWECSRTTFMKHQDKIDNLD